MRSEEGREGGREEGREGGRKGGGGGREEGRKGGRKGGKEEGRGGGRKGGREGGRKGGREGEERRVIMGVGDKDPEKKRVRGKLKRNGRGDLYQLRPRHVTYVPFSIRSPGINQGTPEQ